MSRKSSNEDSGILDGVQPNSLAQATGQELAVREPAIVAEYDDEPESGFSMAGFSAQPDLDTNDYQMPQLKLAQGLTREVTNGEAKPGQWLVPGMEPMDEVTVVPLLEQKGRELRNREEGGKLECHSDDRIIGMGTPGGECSTCPLSAWHDEVNKDGSIRHVPPPCQETLRFIVYCEESDSLALLSFKSRALQVGKKLNTYIKSKGLPARFAVKLGSEKKTGLRGTYALPTISYQKDASPILFERALDLTK